MTDDRCDLICIDAPRAEAIRASLLGEGEALEAAERARALSDPTRLKLAAALRQAGEAGELCVCDLSWIARRSQNLVSHHMRVLRDRGLVCSRRDGKLVMYSLTPAGNSLLGAEEGLVATPATRESNPEIPDGRSARTVLRVEGMDCASCAATVEKGVVRLPGVYRAAVNFAAGRLDAEHDPELAVEEIEKAVRDAGYRVAKTEDAKRAPFWRTPRAISVFASALLFALGLGLSVAGAPEVALAGAYLTAIVVGGMPIFRAALAGVRARHLDMNVLMSAATVGAVGIGQWAEAASV